MIWVGRCLLKLVHIRGTGIKIDVANKEIEPPDN